MAESTLSLTRTTLRSAVGYFLGWGQSGYDSDQNATIDLFIDMGLRSFYHPEPLPGEQVSHSWSFLTPIATLPILSGANAYDMPDDFGGLKGDRVYLSSDDQTWADIQVTNPSRILALQQAGPDAVVGPPEMVAVTPIPTDGTTPTRWSLMVWPTPDSSYSLRYEYHSNPFQLSSTIAYPLGGQPHAETIREACLAAAERETKDIEGVHNAAFRRRLVASVNHDRQRTGPRRFGYNGDPSVGVATPRLKTYSLTTYDGHSFG